MAEHREDPVETVGTETAATDENIITSEPKKESCTNEAHHTSNKVSRRQLPWTIDRGSSTICIINAISSP